MKQFIMICFGALMLLSLSSCKDVKPEFSFELNLKGDVQAVVSGDFDVNVCNVQTDSLQLQAFFNADQALALSAPEGENANAWLDKYIENNVLKYLEPNAVYDIYIKGYIKEKLTGLNFSVDKRITNKAD